MLRLSGLVPRKLSFVLACAFVLALVTLSPYFYKFRGVLSNNSQEWSNFGSYLGGTLGPVYALLAFVAGVQTLLDNRQQATRQSLLWALQRYEADFEVCCSRTVTCVRPWVSGNLPSETFAVKRVVLRTLLYSNAIDWQEHLWRLIESDGFQILENGEISHDQEVILQSTLAIDGIFSYLKMFESADGEPSMIDYFNRRYEGPRNRLQIAAQTAIEGEEREI